MSSLLGSFWSMRVSHLNFLVIRHPLIASSSLMTHERGCRFSLRSVGLLGWVCLPTESKLKSGLVGIVCEDPE